MTKYTVSLSMETETRQFLKQQGYTLYVFKGINAGKGAQSTVWISLTDDLLYNQDPIGISWEEDLFIGETTTQLKQGATVSGTNPYIDSTTITAVNLGQNYIYQGLQWNPDPTTGVNPNAFSIENNTSKVNNFYVSQKSDINPDCIVVQSILGTQGVATFIPIQTISMILSTNEQQKGTIITQAFSPGFIITLIGNQTSINITYDINKGWGGPTGSTSKLAKGDSVYDAMTKSHKSNLDRKSVV